MRPLRNQIDVWLSGMDVLLYGEWMIYGSLFLYLSWFPYYTVYWDGWVENSWFNQRFPNSRLMGRCDSLQNTVECLNSCGYFLRISKRSANTSSVSLATSRDKIERIFWSVSCDWKAYGCTHANTKSGAESLIDCSNCIPSLSSHACSRPSK